MLSMSVQPGIKATLTSRPSSVVKNRSSSPLKTSFSVNTRALHLYSLPNLGLKIGHVRRIQRAGAGTSTAATAAALEEAVTEDSHTELAPQPEVVVADVRLVAKARLVLKFIWMEKNIGVGLDQHIPGHGTVPLSPYFFWPRKDAWEELKAALESKPWISQKKMIILLNQATDIINLWQQSAGNPS